MTESMKDWALQYAGMGFAVFPIKPRDKTPLTSHGFKDATTNKDMISSWWDKYPDANIAVATGSRSGGLVVIDLDRREDKGIDGYEMLIDWQKEHGNLPDTWQSITGGGGYHLFYRDSAINRSRAKLYPGVDVRGEDGYVVVPPSIHSSGNCYTWEIGPGDGVGITQADNTVMDFLMGSVPEEKEQHRFKMADTIPEGERHNALIALIGSEKARGIGNDAIRQTVRSENQEKCIPPLTDIELEKEIFPALTRDWKVESPYYKKDKAVLDSGKYRPVKKHSLDMDILDEIPEEEPEWLIRGHIPKYQITALVGDGGAGKTSAWCSLGAAISSGNPSFLQGNPGGIEIEKVKGQKVMFFSAEDSYRYTLRRKLRKNGADLKNILSMDIADERFKDVKFDSPFLERLIAEHRPALVIFDPVQAFVPPNIKMGERNAMRACLAPLIGYGEKYKCTFLIVVHTNKMSGAWGRKRMADSSDMWDIARSVEMIGETSEPGIRYISQEKSNYGPLRSTILFSLDDEIICYKGMSTKKDKDFVAEASYNTRQAPQKEEAKAFILEFLKNGTKEIAELDEMAKIEGISKNALKEAKAELRKESLTHTWSTGYGKEKTFFISLKDSEKTNE